MGAFSEIFQAPKAKVLGSVTNSMEFGRIMALPRRILDPLTVEDVTPLFARSGELSFWPIQSVALIEAALADGLFAAIGVGHGKTLIGLALAEALDAKKAAYLVKPDLKRQLEREIDTFYSKHFNLPIDRITIISYSELSMATTATVLEDEDYDLVVCDELQCLRHPETARTKRFMRFAKEHESCRFAFLSGTISTRSIIDYAHLIELALRKNSPLPRGYREIRDWAGALDVKPAYHMAPGVLLQLCEKGESVRSGYRRRLIQTQGVVATQESAVDIELVVRKLTPKVPANIKELMAEVHKKWTIEGNELVMAVDKARALKQLACGFYYKWKWPNDEPDHEWLDARRNWYGEVRQKLKRAGEGFDSRALLQRAAENYRLWNEAGRPRPRPKRVWDSVYWEAWRRVKHRKPPPRVTIWKSSFLVKAAIEWAEKQDEPAIIWASWNAIGKRIAEKGGYPFFGQGTDASESTDKIIVVTIDTQGEGKNLQYQFSRNLWLSIPPNGTKVEQGFGRTHRPGQKADKVTCDWFGHTRELEDSMARAIEDAKFKEESEGQRQKILHATRINQKQK